MLCILNLDTLCFSSQQMELTWAKSMECKVIMANVRQYAGGAYLKAVTKKGHEREARITVEFTGNAYEETTGILNVWSKTSLCTRFLSLFFFLHIQCYFNLHRFI